MCRVGIWSHGGARSPGASSPAIRAAHGKWIACCRHLIQVRPVV